MKKYFLYKNRMLLVLFYFIIISPLFPQNDVIKSWIEYDWLTTKKSIEHDRGDIDSLGVMNHGLFEGYDVNYVFNDNDELVYVSYFYPWIYYNIIRYFFMYEDLWDTLYMKITGKQLYESPGDEIGSYLEAGELPYSMEFENICDKSELFKRELWEFYYFWQTEDTIIEFRLFPDLPHLEFIIEFTKKGEGNNLDDGVGVNLLEITASSVLPEEENGVNYKPINLLDSDEKTMWIENKKGSGINEVIKMRFFQSLYIDEIQFQPGCFWENYWNKNNRVKEMEISFHGKKFTALFNDEMKTQSYKFDDPVYFKEIMFRIKSVYPTAKWDDTAISGIKFLYLGNEIPLEDNTD